MRRPLGPLRGVDGLNVDASIGGEGPLFGEAASEASVRSDDDISSLDPDKMFTAVCSSGMDDILR